jgi:hypothetical protein
VPHGHLVRGKKIRESELSIAEATRCGVVGCRNFTTAIEQTCCWVVWRWIGRVWTRDERGAPVRVYVNVSLFRWLGLIRTIAWLLARQAPFRIGTAIDPQEEVHVFQAIAVVHAEVVSITANRWFREVAGYQFYRFVPPAVVADRSKR